MVKREKQVSMEKRLDHSDSEKCQDLTNLPYLCKVAQVGNYEAAPQSASHTKKR